LIPAFVIAGLDPAIHAPAIHAAVSFAGYYKLFVVAALYACIAVKLHHAIRRRLLSA
jgi:hypothetical protein